VQLVESKPRTTSAVSVPGPGQFGAIVAAVVAASWLPVLAGAMTRTAVGWIAAVGLAVAVEWLTRRFTAGLLVSGLVLASAFVASGLVTEPTHYMPVVVTGGAVGLRTMLEAWRSRRMVSVTPRVVLVAVGLYLAWAALATVTSIDHIVSAVYIVGMVAVCGLAIWKIPAALTEQSDCDNLLLSVGVLGAIVALTVYLVEAINPITVFGRALGDYQLADLTIAGHTTGLHFGRSAGIYLAPLEAGITMALAVGMLLGWSVTRVGWPRVLARLGIVVMVPAIVLTLDRTAWLAAIVSAGPFVVLARRARLHAATPAAVCAVFASVFLFVLVGTVGANAIGNFCAPNCTPSTGIDETPLRGGTGLTGREYLWAASIHAIEKRPILGYGPGNNVPALYPFLVGGEPHIETLTSHSTWFRTAVEMGIPGLVFLVFVLLAAAWIFTRDWLRDDGVGDPVRLALAAALCGLVPAMTFESFLLGGVTFSSLFLALALGVVAVRPMSDRAY